jgi:hypothetical protein
MRARTGGIDRTAKGGTDTEGWRHGHALWPDLPPRGQADPRVYRYHIVAPSDPREAARKLEASRGQEREGLEKSRLPEFGQSRA